MAELNSRMGAREFVQWMDYYKSEPFGPVRDNLHSGELAAMLFNINRKKNQRALSAKDFLLMSPADRMAQRTNKTLGTMKAIAQTKRERKKK